MGIWPYFVNLAIAVILRAQVLVSCDGNGFTEELIQMLPELWSDEQQAGPGSFGDVADVGKKLGISC